MRIIVTALVVVFALAAYAVVRYFLLRRLPRIIARSGKGWEKILLDRRVFHLLSYLAPAIVMQWAIASPALLEGYDPLIAFLSKATQVYIVVVAAMVVNAGLMAFLDIYGSLDLSKELPLTSFVQAFSIVVFIIAGFVLISLLLDIPFVFLIGGIGALVAVATFVFRDPILGFGASIQLAANRMVAIGDRIEMSEYGADGDVLEINLTTVKVRNFDNTITTIPTYALISRSFKNWRSMRELGGRRIRRAIYIDMSTIRFCTEEMLEAFSKIDYVSEYIAQKKREMAAEHSPPSQAENSSLVDGRHLTNSAVFRAYVVAYLRNHPLIRQDMDLMVRHRDPAAHGLPVQIYAFCKVTEWISYERIQSDIFDHILAMVPEFDLKVFQYPAGSDLRELTNPWPK